MVLLLEECKQQISCCIRELYSTSEINEENEEKRIQPHGSRPSGNLQNSYWKKLPAPYFSK